jgi:hypothetical protein
MTNVGWAIRRADGTYRGWFANAQDAPLQADETYEELAAPPDITVPAPTDAAILERFDAEKALKALALALSNQTIASVAWSAAGYTPAQIRARFLAAWRQLG